MLRSDTWLLALFAIDKDGLSLRVDKVLLFKAAGNRGPIL